MPLHALAASSLTVSLALSLSTCAGKPKYPPGPPPPPGPTTGPVQPGQPGDLGPCPMFPPDNPWNQDISKAPVDPNSDRYMAAMNAGEKTLHPDFGSSYRYGIPWFAVTKAMPRLEMKFKYDEESDPGPYPFPPDAPVEGGADADGDRHVIGLDRNDCKLYEGFNCWYEPPHWSCESGAVFDLRSNKTRPAGWTSADAAGLPVFPGLVRREEVLRGEIKHALRFTVRKTQRAYVAPATHFASPHRDPNLPPLGIRVRLKADYDISRFSGAPRVILIALKKYGMFLADNGADWFISGESNPAWDDDELRALKKVPASAFEVVKHGEVFRETKP
ncbi:MAG TPA: hypothetical protein VGF45_14175 [Polyangia bacterium]